MKSKIKFLRKVQIKALPKRYFTETKMLKYLKSVQNLIAVEHQPTNRSFRTLGELFVATVCSFGMTTAFAATYYVSSGSGNDNTGAVDNELKPYQTLGKVAKLVNPGDTVLIKNGTYSAFTISRAGSSDTARITWRAYPGHNPEIKSNGTEWQVIKVEASYQTIDGLKITGYNDNITLQQAEADHDAAGGGSSKFNTNGIVVDNRVYPPTNPTTYKAKADQVHSLTVQNCDISKFAGAGIGVLPGDYIVIKNNKIHDNAWYTRYGGSGASIFTTNAPVTYTNAQYPGYRNVVVGNTFWNNKGLVKWKDALGGGKYSDGNGFILDTTSVDDLETEYAGRTLIANNLSVSNGGSGIHAYQAIHADIVNNTGYKNGTQVGYPDIYAMDSKDIRIYNNIMSSRAPSELSAYGTIKTGKANSNYKNTNVIYDYNVYFNGSTEVTGPKDVVADPLFVNPGPDPTTADFSLKAGSPAKKSGIIGALTARTNATFTPTPGSTVAVGSGDYTPLTDLLGVTRSTTGMDRGAYSANKPFVTSSLALIGTVGAEMTYRITASNSPTSYAATGLPPELILNTTTGIITGTPLTAKTYNGTITVNNESGSQTVNITVTIDQLPTGWAVSATTPASGKTEVLNVNANGVWTIAAARTNRLIGTSDSFSSAFQSVLATGDVTIRARIIGNSDNTTLSGAGITLRETEGADSAHVSAIVSPIKGVTYVRRASKGGRTVTTAGPNDSSSVWLELKRVGNVVTCKASENEGQTWVEVRRETLSQVNPVRVGVIAQSSGASSTNTATIDNVSITKL
jgi:Right handed beta helix region